MTQTIKQQLSTAIDFAKQYLKQQKKAGQDIFLFNQPLKQSQSRQSETVAMKKPGPSKEDQTALKDRFDLLAGQVKSCTRCDISKTRKQPVLGEGNLNARLVFVGEAPGADEDQQGRPFVGAAGKLLTKIIESIGLKREEVYICNVLKCRPVGNRNPAPEEIRNCNPYLEEQLEIIKPELICALGTFAAQTLLNTKESIGRLRGQQHTYKEIPVIPTLHPAALLYHPQNKRLVWEDMKTIANFLNLPIKS